MGSCKLLEWCYLARTLTSVPDLHELNYDIVTTLNDQQEGEPLLSSVMKEGRRLAPARSLDDIRTHVTKGLSRIPDWMRRLDYSSSYDVRIFSSTS